VSGQGDFERRIARRGLIFEAAGGAAALARRSRRVRERPDASVGGGNGSGGRQS
jgi:hypothetical protein